MMAILNRIHKHGYLAEDTKVMEISGDGTPVEIQKTGVCCPDCYKDTDTVIWGVHKKLEKK